MTRSMLFVGVAVVLGASVRYARAEEPTPERIIEKALRAHGGEDRLKALTGFVNKSRTVYEKGPDWVLEVAADLPQRYRSEIKIGPEAKTRSLVVIDGDHGWMKIAGNDAETYPPPFLDSMRKYTIPYLGPRSVLRLIDRTRNPKCHVSTTGECTVNGHAAVGLLMKLDGGPQETWYFDKESGLLLQDETRTANFEGEDSVSTTTYEDYRTLDGFPRPRKSTTVRDGKPSSVSELIEFKVEKPSESVFAKP